MKKNRHNKGLTLIEIIISVAILGIIAIAVLNVFVFGYSEIFAAGFRTDKVHDVQLIVDQLNTDNDNQKFTTTSQISTYFTSKGYNVVTDLNQLNIRNGNVDINCHVGSEITKGSIPGFQVSILKFYKNGTRSVQLTTFVIKGGSN